MGHMNQCKKCGLVHERCSAHRSADPKTPCQRWPRKGAKVCAVHGGNSPLSRKAQVKWAEEEAARRKAARELRRFQPVTTANPMSALLELVQYQSGVVAYWRLQVELFEDERDLVWGTVSEEESEDRFGSWVKSVQRAGSPVAYRMLREAQQDLADYASAALRAGFEERQVSLAERQGELLVSVIRGVLAALNLTAEQQKLVPVVVPEQLRLARSGE